MLEVEAFQADALLEDHQSSLMDLKIEADIYQESQDRLLSDHKSMNDYLDSFPPTPKPHIRLDLILNVNMPDEAYTICSVIADKIIEICMKRG